MSEGVYEDPAVIELVNAARVVCEEFAFLSSSVDRLYDAYVAVPIAEEEE